MSKEDKTNGFLIWLYIITILFILFSCAPEKRKYPHKTWIEHDHFVIQTDSTHFYFYDGRSMHPLDSLK